MVLFVLLLLLALIVGGFGFAYETVKWLIIIAVILFIASLVFGGRYWTRR